MRHLGFDGEQPSDGFREPDVGEDAASHVAIADRIDETAEIVANECDADATATIDTSDRFADRRTGRERYAC
ncbi:MAG: hypothetical protein NVS2B3_00320 [Vulcanimicrobiaceae bacterium]